MMLDATYNPVAHHLMRAAQWDLALDYAANDDQRAEILTDRFMWKVERADEAIAAAQHATPALRDQLLAKISYWHKLMDQESPLEIDELAVFTAAKDGWGAFWRGVIYDNALKDPEAAKRSYAEAHELMGDDIFLESFVVRHQAFHLIETDRSQAILLARRSLAIRSALGARPQTVAAQAALAMILPEGDPEAAELREIVWRAAEELNFAWLKKPTD